MASPIHNFAVEGAGSTYVHPLGLLILLVCGTAMVLLPRRVALWAFMALICFVSARQCIAIGGFNLYFPRFMILFFGVARAMVRGELLSMRLNRLDALVVAYGAVYFLAGAFTWNFNLAEMKTRSGYVSEVVGTYLLIRMLVRSPADVRSIATGFALISLPILGFFILEHMTGRNVFSVFGGVPQITEVRDGRLRCQGAFGHPILAGVFWATALPVFLGLALESARRRILFGSASLAAVGLVVLSASSTPLLGLVAGVIATALFPLRRWAPHFFGGMILLTFVLHLSMKAPVWALIQRINVTSGNSGYHRYVLVDGFMTHIHEWWLLGSRVGTSHWGHYSFDTANQFVSIGVAGGLPTLLLFLAINVVAWKACGRISRSEARIGWAVGTSIFVLDVCFLGVSIWGQLHFAWALPIAIAGALGFPRRGSARATLSPRPGASMAEFDRA